MSGHDLASVMTTGGGLARRFVCECGESGPAVGDEGAARGEHHRHAEFRQRVEIRGAINQAIGYIAGHCGWTGGSVEEWWAENRDRFDDQHTLSLLIRAREAVSL